MIAPAGERSLLSVRTGTGFADNVNLVAVPGCGLDLVPTTLFEQRNRHLLSDRATGAGFDIDGLPIILDGLPIIR